MSRDERIFDTDISGICFEDRLGSEVDDFSSVINPKGILASLFDDFGEFRGVVLLNPGETTEIVFNGKRQESEKRWIIFGMMNKFDRYGNITFEYYTGVIRESETIIIVRDGKTFKPRKIYLNTGKTNEISVKIKQHNLH